MKIEDIARICHEANRAYCQTLGDNSQVPWDQAPDWQKASAIAGVKYAAAHPKASCEDSHNCWLAEKLRAGWRYGPTKNADTREHPCCLPYRELPPEQRLKDLLFLRVVQALAIDTL